MEVEVFSFNIVINKYATGNESTKLEGAKFVLKNNDGKYYKCDTATKAVSWVDDKSAATEVTTDATALRALDGSAGRYLQPAGGPSPPPATTSLPRTSPSCWTRMALRPSTGRCLHSRS